LYHTLISNATKWHNIVTNPGYSNFTVQLPHKFILKKYISEIDSEGLLEAVFEKEELEL
jgi:hypothetical protein